MLAAALALHACMNDTYPAQDFVPEQEGIVVPSNDEYVNIERTPIKVRASYQKFFTFGDTRATRGTGPFDSLEANREKYLNTDFYIYAFRADNDESRYPKNAAMRALSATPSLTNTGYTLGRSRDGEHQDCLVDGPDFENGAPWRLSEDGEGRFVLQGWDDTDTGSRRDTLYYSGRHRAVGYNFFGFSFDQFKPGAADTRREADKITYTVPLDGQTDIMMGSALPLDEELATNQYNWLQNTPELRDSILRMNGGYSTTSARASVEPRIELKHKLARFQFQAYAADVACQSIIIDSIAFKAPTRGTMTVAGRNYDDFSFEADQNSFANVYLCDSVGVYKPGTNELFCKKPTRLREKGYGPFRWDESWMEKYVKDDGEFAPTKNKEYFISIGDTLYDGNSAPIRTRATLLLPAADGYEGTIYYKLLLTEENTKPKGDESEEGYFAGYPRPEDGKTIEFFHHVGFTLSLGDGKPFEEGTAYIVKISVYGPRKIFISATIDGDPAPGWDNAGRIDDNTEDWGNKE